MANSTENERAHDARRQGVTGGRRGGLSHALQGHKLQHEQHGDDHDGQGVVDDGAEGFPYRALVNAHGHGNRAVGGQGHARLEGRPRVPRRKGGPAGVADGDGLRPGQALAYVVQIRPDGRHIRQLQPEIVDVRDIMPNVAGKLRSGCLGRFLPKGNDRAPEEKKESDLADEQGDDEAPFPSLGKGGLPSRNTSRINKEPPSTATPRNRSACMEAALPTSAVMPASSNPASTLPTSAPVRFLMGWTIQTFPSASKGLHLAVQRFELVLVLRDGGASGASEGQAAMLRPFPSSTARRADARDFAKTGARARPCPPRVRDLCRNGPDARDRG